MKKAALTIGLFSLVVVTTSFTALEMNSIDPKGSHSGGNKKVDLYSSGQESVVSKNLDFANVNQALGLTKKQD